jgi:hypothetical protein
VGQDGASRLDDVDRAIGKESLRERAAPAAPPARDGLGFEILRLQRVAGNRTVTQLIARSASAQGRRTLARDFVGDARAKMEQDAKAGNFRDPAILAVYHRYGPGTEAQRLGLGILDTDPASPPSGVWKHIAWSNIAADAALRVFDPTLFDQGPLNVCATAATLNLEARNDPRGYAALVWECYKHGTLKDTDFNSELLDTTPQPGMAVVDWMLLSAMQSRANSSHTFNGRPDGHAGTTSKQERWELREYAGAVETDMINTSDDEDVIPATKKVNNLLSSHPNEVEVIIRLSSAVLQNPSSVEHPVDHAVALMKPVTINEDFTPSHHAPPLGLFGTSPPPRHATGGTVSADVFTWGKVMTWTGTVRQWQRMVWAYDIAATRKGIL